VDERDPRYLLARRLRRLRQDHWPGRKITQSQLAQALGGVSVPLISSWESQTNPRIPPPARLDAYAALFASPRSFAEDPPRMFSPREMSDEEQRVMAELRRDLNQLRKAALRATPAMEVRPAPRGGDHDFGQSSGPWHFGDRNNITIVCAQWPPDILKRIPYTDINDPDYTQLLTYSDLDSVVELHGHIRAANPASLTLLQTARRLAPDDYTSHLMSLGGVDWNSATTSVLDRLRLPVRQAVDWSTEGAQFFEVEADGEPARYRPVLTKTGDRAILTEDVALFAFAMNPFNKKRTVTICSGIYSRGTYGAVRALTDVRFRDRNADYLRTRFGNSDAYCILTRVQIINGVIVTPDWTSDEYILFEWSR
jgi:transcriptional regulator with XRE-family HTH domain